MLSWHKVRIAEFYTQPLETHWTLRSNIKKNTGNYCSPKIVCLKTGRIIRAALDYKGIITLQSVYNIHLDPAWAEKGITIEFLCALLNSPRINEAYIKSITDSKALFPQITQKMIKEISFSRPSDTTISEVTTIVKSIALEGTNLFKEESLNKLMYACI